MKFIRFFPVLLSWSLTVNAADSRLLVELTTKNRSLEIQEVQNAEGPACYVYQLKSNLGSRSRPRTETRTLLSSTIRPTVTFDRFLNGEDLQREFGEAGKIVGGSIVGGCILVGTSTSVLTGPGGAAGCGVGAFAGVLYGLVFAGSAQAVEELNETYINSQLKNGDLGVKVSIRQNQMNSIVRDLTENHKSNCQVK